jgi:hypothetical protein
MTTCEHGFVVDIPINNEEEILVAHHVISGATAFTGERADRYNAVALAALALMKRLARGSKHSAKCAASLKPHERYLCLPWRCPRSPSSCCLGAARPHNDSKRRNPQRCRSGRCPNLQCMKTC